MMASMICGFFAEDVSAADRVELLPPPLHDHSATPIGTIIAKRKTFILPI